MRRPRRQRRPRLDHDVARDLIARQTGIKSISELAARTRLSRETIYGWLRHGASGVGPDARADIATTIGEELARAIERIAEGRRR